MTPKPDPACASHREFCWTLLRSGGPESAGHSVSLIFGEEPARGVCQWAGMCSGRLGLHPKSDQGPTSWSGTFDGGKGKGICVRVVHWQSSAPAWRWQAQFSPVLGWPESITWPNSNARDRGKCNCPEDGRRARHTVNSLSVLSVAGHCGTQ